MKKPFLFLLSSLLILGPTLTSCNDNNLKVPNNDAEQNQDNNTDNNSSENGDNDNTEGEGTEGDNDGNEEDIIPDYSNLELLTLSEANEICSNFEGYKNHKFSSEYIRTKGKVLSNFAISSGFHFIILADSTGILPIKVPVSNRVPDYFFIGETYEVIGNPGNILNHNCIDVTKSEYTVFPITKEDPKYETVDVSTLSTPKTIAEVYDEAYTIQVEDNKTNYSENIYKFSATYIDKISDGLALIFDGENHMIVHGESKINNKLLKNKKYEFYCLPSVSQGKRAAEVVGFKCLNIDDETAIKKMGEVAQLKTVNELYNIDRYNDKKALYPNIIKVEGYITAHYASETYNFALVDDPNVNPSYQKGSNDRPKAIYAKNHIISDYDIDYTSSILADYYFTEPAKKGTFYFVPTEYASALHVYKGFFLDSLIQL